MDRLSRFTIPGIAYMLALIYFIYSLSCINILSSFNDSLLTLIAGVLSTPVIGLIITSVLHLFIHLPFIKRHGKPGPYWLYLPKELDPKIYAELCEGKKPKKIKEWKRFYWRYQQKFRSKDACEKVIDFTAHRWTYFFVLINTAFAITLAIATSFAVVYMKLSFDLKVDYLSIGILFSILFSWLAYWLSKFSLNDAREVEYLDVMEKIKTDPNQKTH